MTSAARHHAEWLSLVETSGPFLSMPVLLKAFPQGLDAHDPEHARELRAAVEEWEESAGDPAYHQAWARYVLTKTLQMPDEVLVEGQALPPGLETRVAEHSETLRPDFAVIDPESSEARLLVRVMPPGQDLDKPVEGLRWKATPATRMMELLHASSVKLGLVTNGERWMLVYAPRGETTGFASWYASLWTEEAITLRAFRSLLSVERFFGVSDAETTEALLETSAKDQQEVTDQLGYQVRRAVEVLVGAIDRADKDRGRTLLSGTDEGRLYEAALTVMMRLVFLFSAEERELLLLGDPLYDEYYAVSTLRDQLREAADLQGEEVLERRHDAWSRLLSTFRAVHGGVEHDEMRLRAYGGTLFDPDRYPFLEGREPGTRWRETPAHPLPIHNRTVLHLLEALQILRVKVPGGGPPEARRLSFRALDIEQIGHVYEGLLDHTALRASETILGLTGGKDKEPEVALSTLEALGEKGEDALLDYLKKETGRTVSALGKALAGAELLDEGRWLAAFDNDEDLAERAHLFAGLVREDTSGYPVVILAESAYVTKSSDRRESGTHYTPRSLTEPIVQHTLDPLVYEGPAEGWPKEEWRLRSAREILALTVCDMAMGSAAFLVQACRYLSERLVEAWENAEAASGGRPVVSPEGDILLADTGEEPLARDPAERLALARRIVADRCLYGVDKNPLAVEMGKLSLWLTTLQKDVPFTFLDHALRCGDSLLGITSPDQLTHWSLDPEGTRELSLLSTPVGKALHAALNLRRQLKSFQVRDVRDAEAKARLLREAEEAMALMRLGADLLVAAALQPAKRREAMNEALLSEFVVQLHAHEDLRNGTTTEERAADICRGFDELRAKTDERLSDRRPFHWLLEFPEVFVKTEEPAIIDGRLPLDAGDLLAELSKPKEAFVSGFAVMVGNPPFQGGKKITGSLGTDYRDYLLEHVAGGKRGSADLCAYFFLRARTVIRKGGGAGLLATNSIAQGDTREVGLGQLTGDSCTVTRAVTSRKWPGTANLEVAHVWLRLGLWEGESVLDENSVAGITSYLTVPGSAQGEPYRLSANAGKAFQGSIVLGTGFMLEPEEAEALVANEPRNREVLFPYLTGEDLNARPDQSPSRFVINFRDWPLERAREYPDLLQILTDRVKLERDAIVARGKQIHEYDYWKFWDKRLESYASIANLDRVLVVAQTSRTLAFAFVPQGIVYAMMTIVFAFDKAWALAVLQSSFHDTWARHYASTMKLDLRYTPTNVFETFPFPPSITGLEDIGEEYHAHRQRIMQSRKEGLTKTYNRFHDPDESAEDIERLRGLHVEMDKAVGDAYGWGDLDLEHGFHETKQGLRFTISEEARREILDRLHLLNHERYAEEVKQGLHDKKAKKGGARKQGRKEANDGAHSLFGPGDGS